MSDLNYKIIFSKKSEVDLIGILQYTETTFGYLQKEVYQGKFFKAFSNLSKHPEIGHKNKQLQENLKVLRIEKHYLIYEINKIEETINVIRIVHIKTDLENIK